LLSVPETDSVVPGISIDRHPKTLSECVVNGKLDAQRHFQYKKKQFDIDLLKSKSLVQGEEEEEEEEESADLKLLQQRGVWNKPKKRRKQKHGVMSTDTATGLRCCLSLTMSLW
jgi:hypothetical protein